MVVDDTGDWGTVGHRLRLAREALGMSVRELSRRVDVSPGHVSQVERGLASFSVRALYTVANELGISMDSLFESISTPPEDLYLLAEPQISQLDDLDVLKEAGIILRRADRPSLKLSDGPRWERLTAKPEASSEFLEVVYAPDPGAAPPTDLVRHIGREYGLVTSGVLNVQVGFERSALGTGDTIAFDSDVPHRFWNSSSDEVHAIWFVLDDAQADTAKVDLPPARSAAHR
ncbi:XRE family transcriptional regulator [Frigoribacterium sp. UYMn621]|jgi:transcriptional regulator with XRE-family HTH domain|uniref:helix-turn-helix domain-containing protein n=1 Tax=Frigoribacterium sp. UYMn621 TaxID=3156343 RepID=UPI00339ADA67